MWKDYGFPEGETERDACVHDVKVVLVNPRLLNIPFNFFTLSRFCKGSLISNGLLNSSLTKQCQYDRFIYKVKDILFSFVSSDNTSHLLRCIPSKVKLGEAKRIS